MTEPEEESFIPYKRKSLEDVRKDEEDQVIDHNFAPTKSQKVKKSVKKTIEGAAKELNVNLPDPDAPLAIRLVALLTLVGGLSAVGSTFAEMFNREPTDLVSYSLRIFAGGLFIIISYGLFRRERWPMWTLLILVGVAFFLNYISAVVPALLLILLFFEREYLKPSRFDRWLSKHFFKDKNEIH